VDLTKNGLLASDLRDDFRGGGRTSLLLPPGAENPSYATDLSKSTFCTQNFCAFVIHVRLMWS